MSFTEYSSIFELLCGYNFVNSVNETDALKFLDLTTPLKLRVENTIDSLDKEIERLIEDNGTGKEVTPEQKKASTKKTGAILYEMHKYKQRAEDARTQIKTHSVYASNLYLIGGFFCFFTLFFSGLSESFIKLNSFPLFFIGTLFLYLLFLKCDFIRKNKSLKWGLIIFISGCIVYSFLKECNWLGKSLMRWDNLYLVVLLNSILLLLIIIFRKWIIKRKTYKSIFIISFLIVLFIPDTYFLYDLFYSNDPQQNNGLELSLIIVAIIIGLLPFIFDVISNTLLLQKISAISDDVTIYVQSELKKGGMDISGEDIDPIKL